MITSRNAAMQCLTLPENSLEVTEMEEIDAIELLIKASCLDSCTMELQAEASKIVEELSYLPLAVDQAGAYIASGATPIGDYLLSIEKHYYPILNLLELLSIAELSMKLGSYRTKKFNKGLNLMIIIWPIQLIVQCSFWRYFLSSIMRESLWKFFLMLLFKKIKKSLTQICHLPVLYWIRGYFL